MQHARRKTKNAPTGIDQVVLAISVALEDVGAFVELPAGDFNGQFDGRKRDVDPVRVAADIDGL